MALPARSRDELPPVLAGLQWIFVTPDVNEEIFTLLEAKVIGDKMKDTGRPGMDLWQLLVLGVVRLALDCDYAVWSTSPTTHAGQGDDGPLRIS